MAPDLLAGIARPLPSVARYGAGPPRILVFDSGLGGLTVFTEVRRARPDAHLVYAADDAAFPYGALGETDLVARICEVMARLIADHEPQVVVIACNTASTLVLPHLRARFDLPFVGTVPAIKPAAALSRTGRITVLATPGTVARDYTRGLVKAYAGHCRVTLVGSSRLAALAEAELTGRPAPDDEIAAELSPCFVEEAGERTDVVVLACTHYPLLLPRMRRLAPWPVTWIDPAPAIARRLAQILDAPGDLPPSVPGGPEFAPGRRPAMAVFTGGKSLDDILRGALASRGLDIARVAPHPLVRPPVPAMS